MAVNVILLQPLIALIAGILDSDHPATAELHRCRLPHYRISLDCCCSCPGDVMAMTIAVTFQCEAATFTSRRGGTYVRDELYDEY
jgi:hypothetical protein